MTTSSSPGGYTEGPIPWHIARLSGVMILGFLSMTIGFLIEVFYVGQVGKLALAALTFSFPIAMSLNALSRGIGIGAAALVAQRVGAGNQTGATQVTTHCFILLLIFTISVMLLGQFTATAVFSALGASGETLRLATEYMYLWLIGFPLMGIAMVANGLIRSFGDPTYPGIIMATGPILQVLAGPFLIFGWLGLPAMGLNGAAWAFVAGTVGQVALVAHWFFIKHKRISLSLEGFGDTAYTILQVGIPAGATNLLQPLSMVLMTYLLAGFGTTIVAAFGVASRIESVVAMVVVGISAAVIPMVGQNWGARQFERVKVTLRLCYIASHLWAVIAIIVMWTLSPLIVSLVNDDPNLVDAAVTYLYIIPLGIGFNGMYIIATASFNAVRRPAPALILSVARLVFVFLPLALLLGAEFGYEGVFAATALSAFIVGIVSWLWAKRLLHREAQTLLLES